MEVSAIYQTTSKAPPQTGKIDVHLERDLSARNSQILTSTYGEAKGGSLQIQADSIRLSQSFATTTTAISSEQLPKTGRGGDISVRANRVAVLEGSQLGCNLLAAELYPLDGGNMSGESIGPFDSGTIHIQVKNQFRLDHGQVTARSNGSGRNGLPLQPGGWQPAPILLLFPKSIHPGDSLHGSKECE